MRKAVMEWQLGFSWVGGLAGRGHYISSCFFCCTDRLCWQLNGRVGFDTTLVLSRSVAFSASDGTKEPPSTVSPCWSSLRHLRRIQRV